MTLTDLDTAILDLEGEPVMPRGTKERRIYAMGINPTRYYQRLVGLCENPEAVAYSPVVVNRLRRLRGRRRV